MTTNPQADAARAEMAGRLHAYRDARARLHHDVRAAAEHGMSQAEIARASGLTRQWVAKILNRQ